MLYDNINDKWSSNTDDCNLIYSLKVEAKFYH